MPALAPPATGTHDHPTTDMLATNLDASMVLVGDSGGLSIHEIAPSSLAPGLLVVTTEHGPLYLDPDHHYAVLDLDGTHPDVDERSPAEHPTDAADYDEAAQQAAERPA
jgi:hypothetical protein